MTVDLTPKELEMLHEALNEALRLARAEWSIYGTDKRDCIADIKALRAKLHDVWLPK